MSKRLIVGNPMSGLKYVERLIELVSCKRYKLTCVPIEDSDQPEHPHTLISLPSVAKGSMFLQAVN